MIATLLAVVTLAAEPSLLRLGLDGGAVVRVHAASAPVLSVSAGTISAPRPAGPSEFEADYRPPDDAVPQVAIVTAWSGGELGWLAVPLWGQGDALVKTRRRASITVVIGAQTFGPVVADEKGEALVPVVVPPGVDFARHGKRAIDLHVPPTRTLHAFLARDAVLADRTEEVRVFLVAVTRAGAPRTDAALNVRVDRGTVQPAAPIAPGVYEARWTLPPGVPAVAHLGAALADAPDLIAETGLRIEPGPAARIEVEAAKVSHVAGEGPVRLAVRATDAAGNAAPAPLDFSTSFGALHAEAQGPGRWTLDLSLPDLLEGHDRAEVRAKGAVAEGRVSISLTPAGPASAAFVAPPALVRADGASPVAFRLDVRDRFGNPVHDVRPEASAQAGHAAVRAQDGTFLATWVPPLLHERATSAIQVRAGPAEARAQVTFLPQLRRLAASPRAGFLTNLAGLNTPLLGLEGALRTEALGPQLALSLSADYGFSTRAESVLTGLRANSRLDLGLFAATAAWRLPVGERNTAWAGVGPVLALTRASASLDGVRSASGLSLRPGVQGIAGFERRLGFAVPFVEARAGWAADPALAMLRGPLRFLTFSVGVRLEAL